MEEEHTIGYTGGAPNDCWETPEHVWRSLRDRVEPPRGARVVWDPFYSTGRAGHYLRKHFIKRKRKRKRKRTRTKKRRRRRSSGWGKIRGVVHKKRDFFTWTPDRFDVILTNPPFSRVVEILPRLMGFGKPFAMILKIHTLTAQYIQRALRAEPHNFRLLTDARFGFVHPATGVEAQRAPQGTYWLLYKLFPRRGVHQLRPAIE